MASSRLHRLARQVGKSRTVVVQYLRSYGLRIADSKSAFVPIEYQRLLRVRFKATTPKDEVECPLCGFTITCLTVESHHLQKHADVGVVAETREPDRGSMVGTSRSNVTASQSDKSMESTTRTARKRDNKKYTLPPGSSKDRELEKKLRKEKLADSQDDQKQLSVDSRAAHLLREYTYSEMAWDCVRFDIRMIRLGRSHRFPLPLASKSWNSNISKFIDYSPSVQVYINRRNAGGLAAILNLDVIIGVCLNILGSSYDKSTSVQDVTSQSISDRLSALPHDHYKSIRWLHARHHPFYSILEIKERIVHSSVTSTRKTFIFTVLTSSMGYLVVESLDERTATHVCSFSIDNQFDYFVAKARLRQYFQGTTVNKREKLYYTEHMQSLQIDRLGSVNHTDFDGWCDRLGQLLV